MSDENMTAVVETNEAANAATATEATPVETTETATAEPVKSKRQRKAERKAKLNGEAESKPSKGKKGKPKADKAPVTATVRDAFGNRLGTSSAAINATIMGAKVPLTVKEIHERTGAEGRATPAATRGHVMWLLARGHVKLKDGAYVKAPAKKRKGQPTTAGESPASEESKAAE